jgi:pimeloyl-ACP methyl ester carboxylesterase
MGDFEKITVELQSGAAVRVDAWPGSDAAQPIIIVAPGTSAEDWSEFSARIMASRAPVLAGVSSAFELVLLIWEIGEPVLLLSQGDEAAAWVSHAVNSAPGAVTALAIYNGMIPAELVGMMHAVSTLILRGRQSKLHSHEDAVRTHESIPNSMLIEPEDCGDFPAKDNPDAAAAALNLFIAGSGDPGESANGDSDPEPVDPKS